MASRSYWKNGSNGLLGVSDEWLGITDMPQFSILRTADRFLPRL
jgi:hypothetical protein